MRIANLIEYIYKIIVFFVQNLQNGLEIINLILIFVLTL
jgi:hypothetical protein